MLIGKSVKIDNPHRLKDFYPSFRVVEGYPVMRGDYIVVTKKADPLTNGRFIYVVKQDWDVDLDKPSAVVELLKQTKRLSKKDEEILLGEKDPKVFWRKVRMFFHFGVLGEEEDQGSIYKLFCALPEPDREIYRAYKGVVVPIPVIFSSLLTMLLKAQSFKELQGSVNPYYLIQLKKINQSLKNVKQKTLVYMSMGRVGSSELNFLWYLFSLKRG